MNRAFPAHQHESMAQLLISRILSNIRHTQENNLSSEEPTQNTEGNKVSVLKDTNKMSDVPSHTRHLNIPNKLFDSMGEQ